MSAELSVSNRTCAPHAQRRRVSASTRTGEMGNCFLQALSESAIDLARNDGHLSREHIPNLTGNFWQRELATENSPCSTVHPAGGRNPGAKNYVCHIGLERHCCK